MQTNKWRHLLLPVLVISQLAAANQPASDTLTPQSEVKKDNALTGAGIPVSPPDAVRPADPVTQDNSFGSPAVPLASQLRACRAGAAHPTGTGRATRRAAYRSSDTNRPGAGCSL